MHPNPAFRRTDPQRSLAFARDRGFGTLAVNAAAGPLLSHIPFTLSPAGDHAELHLVRSNPISIAVAEDVPAVLSVQGPDSYVSPDWYGIPDQVPTWNYVAVHLRGRLERLPDCELRRVLDTLSDSFEARLAPKPAWRTDKMPPDLMDRLMRSLVPFALHVEQIDSTWKLNQNKDAAVRLSAAEQVAEHGIGSETERLSEMMREPG